MRGQPAEEIGNFAREIEADLIVVGHRRQSAFDRWWSGPKGAYLTVYLLLAMPSVTKLLRRLLRGTAERATKLFLQISICHNLPEVVSYLQIVSAGTFLARSSSASYPEQGLKAAWEEFLAEINPNGALDGETKELIGLAVAAQIPCEYCILLPHKSGKSRWCHRCPD